MSDAEMFDAIVFQPGLPHDAGFVDATVQPRRFASNWPGVLLLMLVTVAVYIPALHGTFLWDDPDYIVNNRPLRTLGGLWQIWSQPRASPQYYPLVFSSFWMEYHVWGLWPVGYHVVNLALHLASALLVWRIMDCLGLPGGWLAASIFALHPIEVESVAWMSERKNVLSTLFYLLALLVYLKRGSPKHYALALLLFCAALLSKSVTASFPAAVLVVFWWRDGFIRRRDVLRLLPFFALGLASGLFTAYLERNHVGARPDKIAELNIALLDRLMIAGRVVWFYAEKLLWPWPISFIYPRWEIDWHSVGQWIYPLLTGAVVIGAMTLRKRFGRAPLTIVLLFVGTLFPVLGFVSVYPMRYSFVADHFQYLAGLALIVPASVLLVRYAKKFSVLVLLPLAVLTLLRTPAYSDAETLWRDTLVKNPGSWMVCTNLAHALIARGHTDEAAELYLRALEFAPQLFETHANAGTVFGMRGDYDRALAELQTSLQLNPEFPEAFYTWGQVLQHQSKPLEALEKYRQALALQPNYAEASYRSAKILLQLGRDDEALNAYRQAIAGNPDYAQARQELALQLLKHQEYPEAEANLVEVLRLQPNDPLALTNLGVAELQAGHVEQAVQRFQQALTVQPDFAPAAEGLRAARSMPHTH